MTKSTQWPRLWLPAVAIVFGLAPAMYCTNKASRVQKQSIPGPVIVSPAAGATVQGIVQFRAAVPESVTYSSLEYQINRRTVSTPLTDAPYEFSWQSASVWDGTVWVRTVARDARGELAAVSPELGVKVANHSTELRFSSPRHSENVSGIVDWVVETNLSAGAGKPIFFCLVDGQSYKLHFTNDRKLTMPLDTRLLQNGDHELLCSLDAELPAGDRKNGLAMAWAAIAVENGRQLIELRPNWSSIEVVPGGKAALSASRIFTNGEEEPGEGLQFSTANHEIATIDPDGSVAGVAAGRTTLHVTGYGLSAQIPVTVGASRFPHFTKSGQIVDEYDRDRSLWVRNMFSLDANEVEQTPGLGEQMQAAAINALSGAIYRNPVWGRHSSFDSWKREFDPQLRLLSKISNKYDFNLLLTGDDIARTRPELFNTLTNPWAADAIRYALTWARDTRRVISIDMVDEVDFLWGSTPQPQDNRWREGSNGVDNDAFSRLLGMLSVEGRPPISWPVSGGASPEVAGNWMSTGLSDYNSIFWHYTLWRKAWPDSPANGQIFFDISRTLAERLPLAPPNRPMLLLVQTGGPEYRKRVPGEQFVPGEDEMLSPGHTPAQISAQIMYAAAAGAAGVRAYVYDNKSMSGIRKETPVGVGQHQTGSEPFHVGKDRWAAVSAAFNLIRTLEPHLLQPLASAVSLGPGIFTGARQGSGSRVLLAVSTTEVASTRRVQLDAYAYASGAIKQYRIQGSKVTSEELDSSQKNLVITFQPAETVVWLLEDQSDSAKAMLRK